MRNSTEPRYKKYVENCCGFCYLQENLEINMVKN